MNYIPIHTNIAPSYNYVSAENAYLKQDIEYKNAVLAEQQSVVTGLRAEVSKLSQMTASYSKERDQFAADAERWRVMKKIIQSQGGDKHLYEVQKIVDKDIERERSGKARKASVE
jgi:cytochrome c biogenesis protein ResB